MTEDNHDNDWKLRKLAAEFKQQRLANQPSLTPETDELLNSFPRYEGTTTYGWFEIDKLINFARKIERERDEARATCVQIDLSHLQLEAERDQLRKVADELAKSARDFHPINIPTCKGCHALAAYNELPHVKGKCPPERG